MRYSQVSLALTLYDDDVFRATLHLMRWEDGKLTGSEILQQSWHNTSETFAVIANYCFDLVEAERQLRAARAD